MLSFNLLALAKNHNFFGQIDHYMKEYARIITTISKGKGLNHLLRNLENGLNKEIAIVTKINDSNFLQENPSLTYKERHYPLHHNVLAQSTFQFSPLAIKSERINDYKNLQ